MATTASSVVDFMRSRGFTSSGERFPLYDTRKKLYESIGLNTQLGEFRGDANQNTALLNKMSSAEKNIGVSINPQNLFDIVRTANRGGTAVPIGQTAEESARQVGLPGVPVGGVAGAPTFQESASTVPTPSVPETQTPETQTTATDITGADFQTKQYSANELLAAAGEKFAGSAEFPIKQEEFSAEKTALQLQGQAEKETFIKNLASKGLIFSGKKTTGTSAIEAETLAKQLGVDRKYALFVAQGLQTAAQDIAKEAQKGNEMALTSLRSLGYDVNPVTGKIEATLAARKAEEQETQFAEREQRLLDQQKLGEEHFVAQQDLREAQFEFNQAKSAEQFRQAQERIDNALNKLTSSESKKADITDMSKVLQTRSGSDGFISPDDYMTAKRAWVKEGNSAKDFDETFSVYRNPSNSGYNIN